MVPCIDEPHCRSTVVPHTPSGHPATSGAIRPMFQPCSPTCVTQPICTSSTSAGSRPVRATSPFSTWAASSSARTEESAPFRLPIGERTASTMKASPIDDRLETPAPHAFELALSPLLERDPRAGDEVADGARDQHLSRVCLSRDARARVHGDPTHLAVHQLALTGMEARPQLETEGPDRVSDRARRANRPRRPVEGGEEAVARGVDLATAKPRQLLPDGCVMGLEKLAPAAVAELGGSPRRLDE